MPEVQRVREHTISDGDTAERLTTVDTHREPVLEPDTVVADRDNTLARAIWFVAGILLALLAFRFVLALLGANPSNGFANFIYTASHPFVAPFFSLFSYNLHYGVSRFEAFTLVAMAVYALIAYALAQATRIGHGHHVTHA